MNRINILIIIILLAVIGVVAAVILRQEETVEDKVGPEPARVNLYYYNPDLDRDEEGNIMCSRQGLEAVAREIVSRDIIEETVKTHLKGELTPAERARGITTEYPLPGFGLRNATLQDKVLTLEFDDPQNRTVGGACRVGILWFQIEATAKQFPDVETARFLPEELFQP